MTDQLKTPDVEVVRNGEPDGGGGQSIVLARNVFPERLSVIPLNYRPLFPKMTVPFLLDDAEMIGVIKGILKGEGLKYVGLILRKTQPAGGNGSKTRAADLHGVGVIAEIAEVAQPAGEKGPMHVMLSALDRFRVEQVIQDAPHIIVKPQYVIETEMVGNLELKAYSLSVVKSIKDLVRLNPLHKEELSLFLANTNLNEPGRLADFAAIMTSSSGEELQDVLETVSILDRLRKVLVLLKREVDISRIQVQIGKQIEEKVSKQQREFFLREQLKAIKKELGLQKEGKEAEVERFEERIKGLKLSAEASERISEEIEKLKLIEPASPEFNVSRTYLDWLTILPWGVFTEDSFDIRKAARILNRDHYGLEDVKERILEFLSVGILKKKIAGSILCFVGPPGVGKTSIGQSIARSIGRNFYRFSVGGIRDEAEIKGHRRTYIGAMPGKFIQVMKVCKSANPVIMLDEIDKIGASYQGDPASALLEVLDPEQNKDFLDHYLDVRFDLSNAFFICTANQLDTIPRPLLDRMEVITLAGYIQQEKLEIARRYLLPKQLEAHGATREQFSFTADALREIIEGYAREPGVRGLEKHIKKIIRKGVRKIVEGKRRVVTVDKPDVVKLLGKRIFTDDTPYKRPVPGVVMGLAWTSMGGDTLYVEATKVSTGQAGFKQTGQLGSVMVESSELAYTYVRSFLDREAKAREFFGKTYIHLHVPAGATPKDGPSAGITMAVALYSLAKGQPVRPGIAMTGELTLTGRIMPIGGVKEKTIAAKRANVTNLIFPAGNRKDFEELPSHVKRGLSVHFVQSFAGALKICFEEESGRKRKTVRPR